MKNINDLICEIGGFLVVILIILFIGLIWFDPKLMIKLIATCLLLIGLVFLLDIATK